MKSQPRRGNDARDQVEAISPPPEEAYVIFVAETEIWWLKLLKPGYRHCFVILRKGKNWLILDPLAHQTALDIIQDQPGLDPVTWYKNLGHKVVPCRVENAVLKMAPLAPFTCVEAVKRVLGIHLGAIRTPWQLYQHLCKR